MLAQGLALLLFSLAAAHNTTFTNPILPGFYPDPSCVYVAEWNQTIFCASSSFNVFPGIPVHASNNLVDWNPISNVINRVQQVPGLAFANGSTSGIWAPSIRYHDGEFWVFTTNVYDKEAFDDPKRWDNMLFRTSNPYDETAWSDPVHFDFIGYDVFPWWDSNGKTYVVGSHPWKVSPGINLMELDFDTGAAGEVRNLWNGTGGLAPEGPRIHHRNGYYYLNVAEGGTGLNHMQTMARSRGLFGPYEANPSNPYLTNANTTEYFQTVGHADLFEDAAGNWWAVALATRSGPMYVDYPMGRETVLAAANWDGDWPVVDPVRGVMDGPLPQRNDCTGLVIAEEDVKFTPGFKIPQHWVFYRLPNPSSLVINESLTLLPSKYNLTGIDAVIPASPAQTFIGRRQTHSLCEYSVDIDYAPETEGEEAGVSVMLVQAHHIDFGIVMLAGQRTFRIRTTSLSTPPRDDITLPVPTNLTSITLAITASNLTHYAFSFGPVGRRSDLQTVGYGLAADVSYGFTGTLLGVYASGNGGNGSTPAHISRWRYRPLEQYRD